ncbi:MAG: ATP-dependent sacrificial sulfur transferase LarE [Lachnospiraceae bacterium]|nr:ATP-dependent sacrificial sulfur transferase LarE [Lachnospiraceae bacterium]
MDEKKEIFQKLEEMKKVIRGYERAAIAFSSGVDSTFLLKVAHDVLGDQVIAVTASSHFFPGRELEEAKSFCEKEGIKQIICEIDELELKGFCQNPANRCYLCKRELFQQFRAVAQEHHMAVLAEGSNVDDEGDYRPGLQAIAELGIKSPLREAGLTKQEIRELSRIFGLPTWEKPSFACLASRFVYGEKITREKLSMVEQAEQLLADLGFSQARVRIHGTMARIEVLPEEIQGLTEKETRLKITKRFKQYGFSYVTVDLQGYRTGSMNETLSVGLH